jgi:hypothetical protein
LLVLFPSTWWEELAVPHLKPEGKWKVASGMVTPDPLSVERRTQ